MPSRTTPRFLPAIKTVMSSSHRLFFVRFRSLPGETRLVSGFCQYAGPSDNRALCKVADLCPTCRVYSPLSLRLRLHNAGDYPTCQMSSGSSRQAHAARSPLSALVSDPPPAPPAGSAGGEQEFHWPPRISKYNWGKAHYVVIPVASSSTGYIIRSDYAMDN